MSWWVDTRRWCWMLLLWVQVRSTLVVRLPKHSVPFRPSSHSTFSSLELSFPRYGTSCDHCTCLFFITLLILVSSMSWEGHLTCHACSSLTCHCPSSHSISFRGGSKPSCRVSSLLAIGLHMLVEMSDTTSQVSLHADPNSKVWSESDSWWRWFCPSDSFSLKMIFWRGATPQQSQLSSILNCLASRDNFLFAALIRDAIRHW